MGIDCANVTITSAAALESVAVETAMAEISCY
jgi:hypothetical protein